MSLPTNTVSPLRQKKNRTGENKTTLVSERTILGTHRGTSNLPRACANAGPVGWSAVEHCRVCIWEAGDVTDIYPSDGGREQSESEVSGEIHFDGLIGGYWGGIGFGIASMGGNRSTPGPPGVVRVVRVRICETLYLIERWT